MRNELSISSSRIFFYALVLVVIINTIAYFTDSILVLNLINIFFIPALLIGYFLKRIGTSVLLVLGFLGVFLGDVAFAFTNYGLLEKSYNLMYIIGCFCLIGAVWSKFSFIKMDKVVGTYLMLMFLISAYFLFVFFGLVKSNSPDSAEILFVTLKSACLLIMSFIALAIYLIKESRASILFLMLSMCFLSSKILNDISLYYVYDLRLAMLDRTLHLLGFLFLFKYIVVSNREHDVISAKNFLKPSENVWFSPEKSNVLFK
ncbi:hypothetical protein ACFFU9_14185 [Mariniflexile ostreae]|uniref:YhhN-like protein n=1 Tax=Mariniflexile ostreae TaxID=1520892 RepID=A0ABV5FEN0_9FLAO